jgi:hypothetical protein
MLDDGPQKKKQKTDTSITSVAQSTHNVEQDGYGKNMHPTTSVHISAWPTTVNGKLIRTTWCDLDFSSSDEKKPIYVPYSAFHFWTGPDFKTSNNSLTNYMNCHPAAVGAKYHRFKFTITNQATTRKRLLTQGTTNTITHDFETSQNLLLIWDNIRTRHIDVSNDEITKPPWVKGPDDMQSGDCPWKIEELATGHTKTIVFTPDHPPHPNFFEPISLDTTSPHAGKLIPGRQRTSTLSYDTCINQEKFIASFDYKHTSIEPRCNRPAFFLDQPHILAESGIMKFIYRVFLTFEVDYTLYLRSYELQDKNYQRLIVPLSQARANDKTKKFTIVHTPNMGPT